MIGQQRIGSTRRRRGSRLIFSALLVVSLIIYLSAKGNDAAFQTARKNANSIATTVLTYLSLPVRGMENFVSDVQLRFAAHSENAKLKQELTRLRDVEARANELAGKLAAYEQILGVEMAPGIPEEKIVARAVSEIDGPFVRTALINVGTQQGVSNGDAVMTVNGFYGHIIEAGKKSSRVLQVEDLNSRIAVMSKRTQSRAILAGNNSSTPELAYLSLQSDWQDGDEIMTSGDDGVLPMGLPIGTVKLKDEGRADVDLYVNKDFVDWVWVYPFEKTPKPEDTTEQVLRDENADAESVAQNSEGSPVDR